MFYLILIGRTNFPRDLQFENGLPRPQWANCIHEFEHNLLLDFQYQVSSLDPEIRRFELRPSYYRDR